MEHDRKPRNKPIHPWSINLRQRRQDYNGREIASSINVALKIGQLHVKLEYSLAS